MRLLCHRAEQSQETEQVCNPRQAKRDAFALVVQDVQPISELKQELLSRIRAKLVRAHAASRHCLENGRAKHWVAHDFDVEEVARTVVTTQQHEGGSAISSVCGEASQTNMHAGAAYVSSPSWKEMAMLDSASVLCSFDQPTSSACSALALICQWPTKELIKQQTVGWHKRVCMQPLTPSSAAPTVPLSSPSNSPSSLT